MALLAVDAGNTRIKWALSDAAAAGGWAKPGFAAATATAAELAPLGKLAATADAVGLCCVGGEGLRARLGAALAGAKTTEVVASASCAGVRNLYAQPAALGADRWCALLGLRARFGHGVVVTCGTAITIDALSAAGDFAGGLILPGRAAQVAALEATTQLSLPPAQELAAVAAAAIATTEEAVATGVLAAAAGAVKWYINHRELAAAPLVLAGGDASWLAPQLPRAQIDDALIFAGIACALESS